MGILNITPDSFYDGGTLKSDKDILNRTEKMLLEGAAFIDVGAYSSRPGAEFVSLEEEKNRITPVLKTILNEFPETIISVDTFRAEVANKALNEGAAIINDISGSQLDNKMLEVIAKHKVPYIAMHMKGTPEKMMNDTNYSDLFKDLIFYFSKIISNARELGINDIIIDPGFGFSKTLEQNYELLKNLELFSILERALLIGVSRKSMIYKTLNNSPKDALNGTSILNTIAIQKGANILRVHDVKEAMECITLTNKLKS
jgi:dihydropteroate synthase